MGGIYGRRTSEITLVVGVNMACGDSQHDTLGPGPARLRQGGKIGPEAGNDPASGLQTGRNLDRRRQDRQARQASRVHALVPGVERIDGPIHICQYY